MPASFAARMAFQIKTGFSFGRLAKYHGYLIDIGCHRLDARLIAAVKERCSGKNTFYGDLMVGTYGTPD